MQSKTIPGVIMNYIKTIRIFLFHLIFLTLPGILFSQQKYQIKALAKYKKNTILIRWAPADPYVWQLGVKYGYIIERFNVLEDGKLNDKLAQKGKPLSSAPIKPYPVEAFEELSKTEDLAGVVQEAIYGEVFQSNFNGNSPGAVMKEKQELENRFGLALFACDMSSKTAIAAGLMWMDKNLNKGTRYIYRISLAETPAGVTVEPGIIVVDAGVEKALPAPEKLKIKFSDQQATLSWPVRFHRGIYTAYIIERSSDGKNFKPVTDLPYVNSSEKPNPEYSFYADSLPENHKTFYYRIKGLSPFGEKGPASSVVSGKGHKTLDGIVWIDSIQAINNKEIFLSWNFPKDHGQLFKGFFVERANDPEGPYNSLHPKILPVSQQSFVDKVPKTNSYYRIKYLSKEKEESFYSFPHLGQLMDTIPPTPPLQVTGKADTTGVVSLNWKNNAEEDLLGYRIFRSNNLREEFVELTNEILKTPAFIDTINLETLTKQVYYKVVAVDRYYNPSEYSLPFTLKRPDVVPPASPVFSKSERKENNIMLAWQPSISEDVKEYELYRKEKGHDSLIRISKWASNLIRNEFKDSTAILGKSYKYILVACDSAGNKSKTDSRDVFFETGIRKPVAQIKSVVDRTNRKILIEWKYDEPQASKCIIYKSREGEPTKIYQTLPGNARVFEDYDLSVNNVYVYKIKVILKGGVQSQMSEEVKVRY